MRRLAAIALIAFALAGPAGAQQGRIGEVPGPPPLRGAAEPEAPLPIPEPILLAAPPSFSATPTATADAGRQRMACAKDYYFCLSQDDATECGPAWSACVVASGTSATPAAPGV